MIGIVLTGHGNFARGMTTGLELVLGKQEMYIDVNFPIGDTATELEENMTRAINKLENCENIVVFADILSGSPFNAAIMKAMKDERIKVIYGVNFGMLIEAVMNRNTGMDFNEIVSNAVESGKSQIGAFNANAVIDDDDKL
jgi:PTS system N-acetylgalactosamine-specific IIA component